MKCLVDWCENDAETDDDICYSHWRARVAGTPKTGGDEDGEMLEATCYCGTPMANHRGGDAGCNFGIEMVNEPMRAVYPNIFDSPDISIGPGW